MKFRRKSESEEPVLLEVEVGSVDLDDEQESEVDETEDIPAAEDTPATGAPSRETHGPFDLDEIDEVPPIDLGALLLRPIEGVDLQLQVDQTSGQVVAVLLTTDEGAVELRAFAAPRSGDLWAEARPQLLADAEERGGAIGEREGRWGPEVLCQFPVTMPDGEDGVQASRVVGINGPRWFLRATFLGTPAIDQSVGDEWDRMVADVVVRRGTSPLPVGEPLPLVMPTAE